MKPYSERVPVTDISVGDFIIHNYDGSLKFEEVRSVHVTDTRVFVNGDGVGYLRDRLGYYGLYPVTVEVLRFK